MFKHTEDHSVNEKLNDISYKIDDLTRLNNETYYKILKDIVDVNTNLVNINKKIASLQNIIESQQATIEFLEKRTLSMKEDIEFATIKTYRGWECLYLNGKKLDVDNNTEVSISCYPNEPTRISIEKQ